MLGRGRARYYMVGDEIRPMPEEPLPPELRSTRPVLIGEPSPTPWILGICAAAVVVTLLWVQPWKPSEPTMNAPTGISQVDLDKALQKQKQDLDADHQRQEELAALKRKADEAEAARLKLEQQLTQSQQQPPAPGTDQPPAPINQLAGNSVPGRNGTCHMSDGRIGKELVVNGQKGCLAQTVQR